MKKAGLQKQLFLGSFFCVKSEYMRFCGFCGADCACCIVPIFSQIARLTLMGSVVYTWATVERGKGVIG